MKPFLYFLSSFCKILLSAAKAMFLAVYILFLKDQSLIPNSSHVTPLKVPQLHQTCFGIAVYPVKGSREAAAVWRCELPAFPRSSVMRGALIACLTSSGFLFHKTFVIQLACRPYGSGSTARSRSL